MLYACSDPVVEQDIPYMFKAFQQLFHHVKYSFLSTFFNRVGNNALLIKFSRCVRTQQNYHSRGLQQTYRFCLNFTWSIIGRSGLAISLSAADLTEVKLFGGSIPPKFKLRKYNRPAKIFDTHLKSLYPL